MLDYELLQRSEAQSKQEAERLREKLLVTENRLQAVESLCSTQHTHVGGRRPSCPRGGKRPRAQGPGWGRVQASVDLLFAAQGSVLVARPTRSIPV